MATNDILKFGDDASNILGQSAYAADTDRMEGVSGKARSNLQNKFQRQMSAPAAGISQFVADNNSTDTNVVDTLSASDYANLFLDALSNAPLTTQPQFDNSQKAATTGFVQRALGNFVGIRTYASNTALTSADAGYLILPAGAGLGFSLPLSSTVPNGTKLYFNGNGHGAAITKTGSDVINNGTDGAISAISLLEQDGVILVSVGGGWSVIDGELHQGVSSSFKRSLTANGYQTFPGGLILQWKTAQAVSGILTTTWPIAFPNALLNGWANEAHSIGWAGTDNCTVWGFDLPNSNQTNFTVRVRDVTTGGVFPTTATGTIYGIGY